MTSVKIGRQQWATEDLRVTHFRNGDPIPLAITDDHWHYMDGPLMCITVNGEHLYNWHAVNDKRGLAPKGFCVPSDDQWTELVDFYGGPERAGLRLRAISWGGHESTVFDALPTGGRSQEDGTFRNVGWVAYCAKDDGRPGHTVHQDVVAGSQGDDAADGTLGRPPPQVALGLECLGEVKRAERLAYHLGDGCRVDRAHLLRPITTAFRIRFRMSITVSSFVEFVSAVMVPIAPTTARAISAQCIVKKSHMISI